MKIRFTIARKLFIGFGTLTLALTTTSILTYLTLNENRKLNTEINTIYSPSVDYLSDMTFMLNNSKMLIKNWVFIEKLDNTPEKNRLKELHNKEFPRIKSKLNIIKKDWSKQDADILDKISLMISDSLFVKHQDIMKQLNSFESYEDPNVTFAVQPMVEKDGEIMQLTDKILSDLTKLLDRQRIKADNSSVQMEKSFDNFQRYVIIMGVISLSISFIIGFITISSLVSPINHVKNILLQMGKGILPKEKLSKRSDEIGEMSDALNTLAMGLSELSEFSIAIGQGNFDKQFKPLSDKDILGNSLLRMRDDLQKASEDDKKRKMEDDDRNWFTRGIANFGEILRINGNDLDKLANETIGNLVNYIDANQGGIFILNDLDKENVMLELKGVYAYDRKKHAERMIHIGEGLVGACFVERETMYMTDVPDSYLTITSGLGKSNPRCILIVPLIHNESVYGVMEFASFQPMSKTKIELVEKVAESIASTIANLKINLNTSQLLRDSQLKSERLAQQEEEMRQNVEEMQVLQEEAERKANEAMHLMDAIDRTTLRIEIRLDGTIIVANNNFLKTLEYDENEIINHHIQILVPKDKYSEFDKTWQRICAGQTFDTVVERKTKLGEPIKLMINYSPVYNDEGTINRILCTAIDLSRLLK